MRSRLRCVCLVLPSLGVLLLAPATAADLATSDAVEQWGVFELTIPGPDDGSPYVDVRFAATFQQNQRRVEVPGFYDGHGTYKIRFSPDRRGRWSFVTSSNRPALAGKTGSFQCVAPSPDNHGPVSVVDTYCLQYADGTPYYAVGTTAYQWTSVDQDIQQQTLGTLAKAPFNKIRMCIFPKWYRYGNDTEPWAYPFERAGETNDLTKPNYEFFRNFDQRVRQLRDMGIQADVILFHPYDKWGYENMGREQDDRYLRFVIARLSAFRNVWWSMANEYDLMIHRNVKTMEDFDRFFRICRDEDPHQRLRGIHNWYNTEDHFYDHTKPWVTHASLQTSGFDKAIEWRGRYQKPILFDEMRYEGDVTSGWGNMESERMVSYFWMAGLTGSYGTHGDTFESRPGVRWWAKGGRLVGDSPQRIAFFRQIMEESPVRKMTPSIDPTGKPRSLDDNIYVLAMSGEYYLAYAAKSGTTIGLTLPGDAAYEVERIDTWNMKVTPLPDVQGGPFSYTTRRTYEALRVRRKTSSTVRRGRQ